MKSKAKLVVLVGKGKNDKIYEKYKENEEHSILLPVERMLAMTADVSSIPGKGGYALEEKWPEIEGTMPDNLSKPSQWVIQHAAQALGGEARIMNGAWRWIGEDGEDTLMYFAPPAPKQMWPIVATAVYMLELAAAQHSDEADLPVQSLYVEEPEGLLNQEQIVAVTEILSCLVNNGINITIATNEPLVPMTLNALMRASEIDEDKVKEYSGAILPPKEAILLPESVDAYEVSSSGEEEERIIDENGEIIEDGLRTGEEKVYRYFNVIQYMSERRDEEGCNWG